MNPQDDPSISKLIDDAHAEITNERIVQAMYSREREEKYRERAKSAQEGK